jgi:hypothetical protein
MVRMARRRAGARMSGGRGVAQSTSGVFRCCSIITGDEGDLPTRQRDARFIRGPIVQNDHPQHPPADPRPSRPPSRPGSIPQAPGAAPGRATSSCGPGWGRRRSGRARADAACAAPWRRAARCRCRCCSCRCWRWGACFLARAPATRVRSAAAGRHGAVGARSSARGDAGRRALRTRVADAAHPHRPGRAGTQYVYLDNKDFLLAK